MNKVGKNKKIVLDELQIAQVESLAAYLPVREIAEYFDISESTFHEIRKRQPKVDRAYNGGVSKARIAG
jgi:DNA invertase Pin-like site-specific DNA recombinase